MASYMRNALLLACVALVHPVCSERIKVDFYGEFLCPYCEKFLTKDVGHLFDTGFLAQHVDFRYVPYGNAKVVDGQTVCQHGPDECKGNVILSCAIHLHPALDQWYPFARCVEGDADPLKAVGKCAAKHDIDMQALQSCAHGDLGVQLQQAAANKTASLRPPHEFVPWVVVQGVPLGDSFEQLLRYVCVALQIDPKPSECFDIAAQVHEAGTLAEAVL